LQLLFFVKKYLFINFFFREVIDYIDGIEAPRCVGSNQQYKFFKFYLNNGNSKRIQIVAWNEYVDKVEKHIQSNNVSYIIFGLLTIISTD